MKRVLFSTIAIGVVVVATALVQRQRRAATAEPWYHASDVALLATTGRPQLVEFFHPD